MNEGETREQFVERTARELQCSRLKAEFIVAIELGEIPGDVIPAE